GQDQHVEGSGGAVGVELRDRASAAAEALVERAVGVQARQAEAARSQETAGDRRIPSHDNLPRLLPGTRRIDGQRKRPVRKARNVDAGEALGAETVARGAISGTAVIEGAVAVEAGNQEVGAALGHRPG